MGLRNLLNNYYYGKPGKRDFTEEDLPENRVQLFFQVLGVRKGSMIGLNLIYLLVWLPAALWTVLNLAQAIQQLALQVSGDVLQQILFTWLLILWPLIALTGPFNAGISLVMHRWAQDEHSFPYMDFRLGLKENWKQGLLFGALDGFVPLALYLCARFYLLMSEGSALFLLPLAISVMAACVWFLAAPLVPQLIVSYRQGFPGLIRNAILMSLAQLPRTVGLRLLTLAVPGAMLASLLFFPGALRWIAMIACALYALILLALNKLIWASYSNFLGEKYLNSRIPGARTNIGLRSPKGGDS